MECPGSPLSTASEASAFSTAEPTSPALQQWPLPCYSAFAAIHEPLESDPTDFAGRSLQSLLVTIAQQVAEGVPRPEILHAALQELEKLSFTKKYVTSLCYENRDAIPLMAQILAMQDTKAACKAAVVLWNICFQHKPAIGMVKRLNVINALAALIAHPDKNCQYAASGCLSVLTAASSSCKKNMVQSGCLPYLVACLDSEDSNTVYHAGGCLYYTAAVPQFVQAIVDAGAVPAFRKLLASTSNANNIKLAKRALQRLGACP